MLKPFLPADGDAAKDSFAIYEGYNQSIMRERITNQINSNIPPILSPVQQTVCRLLEINPSLDITSQKSYPKYHPPSTRVADVSDWRASDANLRNVANNDRDSVETFEYPLAQQLSNRGALEWRDGIA